MSKTAKMQVLSVASEIYPLVKTGGLADVAGALPSALVGQGIAVRTLVPGYPSVLSRLGKAKAVRRYDALFGSSATVLAAKLGDLDLLVLDAPDFSRGKAVPMAIPAGGMERQLETLRRSVPRRRGHRGRRGEGLAARSGPCA